VTRNLYRLAQHGGGQKHRSKGLWYAEVMLVVIVLESVY
jgi:hypothetical protein